jgi:hypothetical protein
MTALTRLQADAVLAKHPTWAHCPSCGQMFTSDSAFDRHLGPIPKVGRPKCKAPTEVRKGGERLVYDGARGAWRWDREHPVARLRRGVAAVSPTAQEASPKPSTSIRKGEAA